MSQLTSDTGSREDIVFAHMKESRTDVLIRKENNDNSELIDTATGCTVIKGFSKYSCIFQKHPEIEVGDYLEQLNGRSLEGLTHSEVTQALRDISRDTTITLKIIKTCQVRKPLQELRQWQ